jgi:hypothetical protein
MFPEEEVMEWFVQICMAICYLHKNRLIHRDLKPHNIFLTSHRRIVKVPSVAFHAQARRDTRTCEPTFRPALPQALPPSKEPMSPDALSWGGLLDLVHPVTRRFPLATHTHSLTHTHTFAFLTHSPQHTHIHMHSLHLLTCTRVHAPLLHSPAGPRWGTLV